MPAAAVIPAPKAYIKIVAVKKLVVGFVVRPVGLYSLSDSAVSSLSWLGGAKTRIGRSKF